ncbi:MAG: FtsX-like permease family protein [Culicoidibacterales bacterium]
MKYLIKNIARVIWEQKYSFIIVGVLIILSGSIITLFNAAILENKYAYIAFDEQSNSEQFRIYGEFDAQEFEGKYDIQLHLVEYKEIVENGVYYLVQTTAQRNINKLDYIAQSNKESDGGGVFLSSGYFISNNVSLGDKFEIQDKMFEIRGSVNDIGNTYIHSAKSNSIASSKNVGVYLAPEAFNQIKGEKKEYYLARRNGNTDIGTIIDQLSRDNLGIQAMDSRLVDSHALLPTTLNNNVLYFSLGIIIILGVTIFLLLQFMNEIIKKMKESFAILLLIGYKQKQIIYSFLAILLILPLFFFIGVIIGYQIQSNFILQYQAIFQYRFIAEVNWYKSGIHILFVSFLFILSSVFLVNRTLNSSMINMIKAESKISKMTNILSVANKKIPFSLLSKLRLIFAYPLKYLFFLVSVTISITLFMVGISLNTGYDNSVQDITNNLHYDTQYTLDKPLVLDRDMEGNEYFQTIGKLNKDQDVIYKFIGSQYNVISHVFQDANNKKGVIISQKLHRLSKLDVGQQIQIDINSKTVDLEIVGINRSSNIDTTVYLYEERVGDFYDHRMINGSYDLVKNFEGEQYSQKSKIAYIQEIQTLQASTTSIIVGIVLFTLIMPIIMLLLYIKQTISDNKAIIEMMLVNGYKKSTIYQTLFGGYHLLFISSIALAIGIIPILVNYMTAIFNNVDFAFMLFEISVSQRVYTSLLFIGLYISFSTVCFIKNTRKS